MASYLQTYGVNEERHGRMVKRIVITVASLIVVVVLGALFLHNRPESQKAKHFLADLNAHDYRAAYQEWGCTDKTPCPNYDFNRFMNDWGVKSSGQWAVASTDSCNTFLTINVQAPGSELQSLAVQRSDNSLGFAPSPECQEAKWRWKQFFNRITGHGDAPPPPPRA